MSLRSTLTAVLILALSGAIFLWFQSERQTPDITYVTSEVSIGRLTETVTATGTLQALVTVEVGSELSGRIEALMVDFNDTVEKGQPVARLDRQSLEARLAEAQASLEMTRASIEIKQAELERANADLEDQQANIDVLKARRDGAQARYEAALSELSRKQSLSERGLGTREDLELAEIDTKIEAAAVREAKAILKAGRIRVTAAQTDVKRQKADLANAIASIPEREAVLKLARVELDRTVIRAPIDGVVINRNVSEGQTVAASLEAPTLFTIAQNLAQMELLGRVDETDIGRIRLGQSVRFTVDAFPEREFGGEVVQVRKSPEVIQNVVTYPVVVRTQNDDMALLPGMTASMRILVMETEPLLKAPLAAIQFSPSHEAAEIPDGTSVWTLGSDGVPRQVNVQTGMRDRSHIAVTSEALNMGTQVVTSEIETEPERQFLGIRIGF